MITDHQLADMIAQAIDHHEGGRIDDAEQAYLEILAVDSTQGDALHGLGILQWHLGQFHFAEQNLLNAITFHPNVWRYSCTLGRFFTSVLRFDEAVQAFEKAKNLNPGAIEALFGFANALHAGGKLNAAEIAYRQLISIQAGNYEAWNNLGIILETQGKLAEAVSVLQKGIEIKADYTPLYNNLGNTFLKMSLFDEALDIFQKGLLYDASCAELLFNYGNTLAKQGLSHAAIAAYRQALEIDPCHIKALVNLGNVLRIIGEFTEALVFYKQAIALEPQYYDAYNNAGVAFYGLGRFDEAITHLQHAISFAGNTSVAHNNLGNVLKDAGKLDAALVCYRRALELDEHNVEAHSNLVYLTSFHPDFDEMAILKEASQFFVKQSHLINFEQANHHVHDKSRERKLRIGYVSSDFRNHCQSLFTIPLFANHDFSQFEIYCYAQLVRPDEISERLAGYVDMWRMSYGKTDEQLAKQIYEDKIDILVDLSMHMANGRPLLFARKPAPIQLAWLAYPGTTGIPAMDYRLTDPWLDPPEKGDDAYKEISLRLQDSFWCYDPNISDIEPNPLPALTAGYITFGCLNNFCKVSDDTLCRWGSVMSRTPLSRLILLSHAGQHRDRVYRILGQFGVTADRIEFVEYSPRRQYLKHFHRIDLCLDTLPYNGHTTSIDSYWMGVPVVTKVGRTVAGRAGWSQLNNLGLTELAAFDDEAFIKIAVELAMNLPKLDQLRKALRQRLQISPLMDAKRFANSIETIYKQIWEDWCIAG
jgi:predicted O-linked N-acetylglucosamine transferase (SPINDLY family)